MLRVREGNLTKRDPEDVYEGQMRSDGETPVLIVRDDEVEYDSATDEFTEVKLFNAVILDHQSSFYGHLNHMKPVDKEMVMSDYPFVIEADMTIDARGADKWG